MAEGRNRVRTVVITASIFAAFAVLDYCTPILLLNHGGRSSQWLLALAFGACIA